MKEAAVHRLGSALRSRPLLASAAVLTAAVAIILGSQLRMPRPTATLATSPGTEFSITHAANLKHRPKKNTLSPGSSLEIFQGTVELILASNVRGIFQGPDTITLIDEKHLTLKRGTAWFHVPPEAMGFEVGTPRLQIVDLGTEFGVVSDPDGNDEIHVLSGKIQARVRSGDTTAETLVAGESREVSPAGKLAKISPLPKQFLTKLPDSLPYLHWSFDEPGLHNFTSDGSHPAAGHVATRVISPTEDTAFASIPGKFGLALSSLGKNGYVESDWSGISGAAPRSVAHWIKLPPGGDYYHPLLGWGTRNLTHRVHRSYFTYIRSLPQGAVTALSCDTFWLEGCTPLDDGQWHHLATVYTGRSKSDGDPEIHCYVDGRLEPMKGYKHPYSPRDAQGKLRVDTLTRGPQAMPLALFTAMQNDRKDGHPIAMAIDELFIFQAALSAQQIGNLYRHNQYEPANESVATIDQANSETPVFRKQSNE